MSLTYFARVFVQDGAVAAVHLDTGPIGHDAVIVDQEIEATDMLLVSDHELTAGDVLPYLSVSEGAATLQPQALFRAGPLPGTLT